VQKDFYAPTGRYINCDDCSFIGIDETFLSYIGYCCCENDPVNCVAPGGFISKND